MKKLLVLLFTMSLVLGMTACSSGETDQAQEITPTETEDNADGNEESGEAEVKLAVIPAQIAGDDFWTLLIPAMEKYCEEKGYYLYSEDPKADAATQVTAIENALNKGCKAIFLNCVDAAGIESYALELQEQGIYIMANTELPNSSAIITVDQYASGVAGARNAIEYIKEKFPEGCDIGVIENRARGAASLIERCDGIMDELNGAVESGEIPDCKITAVDAVSVEDVMTATENMLTANPNIKVIVSYTDGVIRGAQEALSGMASVDENFGVFCCGDGVDSALELLQEEGSFVKSTICFDTNIQKEIIVDVMAAMVKEEEFERINSIPATTVDAANAEQYRLK